MNKIGDEKLDKFLWKYREALNFLENQIGSFVSSIDANGEYNPVEHFSGRIKSIDSIRGKLNRRGLEFSLDSIANNLEDIAGVRIVCHFMNDLNKMIEFIRKNPFIKVVEVEDYISEPKESGYSSYHMTVKVPVIDDNQIVYVPAEIQIRTIAMDMWATIDHKILYKPVCPVNDCKKISEIIKKISDETREIDMELESICESSEYKRRDVFGDWLYLPSNVENSINEKYQLGLDKLKCIMNEIFSGFSDEQKKSIELLRGRLKKSDSICRKLVSKNIYTFDVETIDDNLNDVIGYRVVCSFISEMYTIIDAIVGYFGKDNVRIKDYVANPKPNGYSSYHILVKIPVYYKGKMEFLNAEIQVRTKAMNMWASFHHKLCYKKAKVSEDTSLTLTKWALVIRKMDEAYDYIYRMTNGAVITNSTNDKKENGIKRRERCITTKGKSN